MKGDALLKFPQPSSSVRMISTRRLHQQFHLNFSCATHVVSIPAAALSGPHDHRRHPFQHDSGRIISCFLVYVPQVKMPSLPIPVRQARIQLVASRNPTQRQQPLCVAQRRLRSADTPLLHCLPSGPVVRSSDAAASSSELLECTPEFGEVSPWRTTGEHCRPSTVRRQGDRRRRAALREPAVLPLEGHARKICRQTMGYWYGVQQNSFEIFPSDSTSNWGALPYSMLAGERVRRLYAQTQEV